MQLLLPQVAGRSCKTCRHWIHDEKGRRKTKPSIDPATGNSIDVYIERPNPDDVDCERHLRGIGKGCPKGHWKNPQDFGLRERKAYEFYVGCQATASWPDDPLIRWCARIIANAEKESRDHLERQRFEAMIEVQTLALSAKGI